MQVDEIEAMCVNAVCVFWAFWLCAGTVLLLMLMLMLAPA
jgi:hypothetical protein